MYVFKNDKKHQIMIVVFILCLLAGIFFARIFQPAGKTSKIYKQALKDYDNGNYSNSYYLFSKVSQSSSLKPAAIYRQALCAKALGDKESELKRYQELFHRFPKNKLSPEAKYQAGQLLIDDNPNLALKYFTSVSKSEINEDYKIAADYYKARIAASKLRYSNKKLFARTKAINIEKSFRQYIEKYPNGRLAVNVANSWKKFNPKMSKTDVVLLIRAYYMAGMYKEATELYKDTDIDKSWALQASTAYSTHDYNKTLTLTEQGVAKYADFVTEEDYKRSVDNYLQMFDKSERPEYTTKLLSLAQGKKKAYIWNLKCSNLEQKEKYACYKDLYINFPEGKYAEDAMLQVFLHGIRTRNYAKCYELAKEFMKRYPDSEYIPLVMFWTGKIEQKYYFKPDYAQYYQNIINRYPDSYYAYRAFWILKNVGNGVINASLDYKPVEYPYQYPAPNDILYSLLAVQDYDMIVKYAQDDFIRSWVEYKKGNYSSSVVIARDAMDKLKVKPAKNDLRWRLVYPQNYYKQIKGYSAQYQNNEALMISLVREESTFNPEAQSGVGAIGLMQLMPTTAHDIGDKHSIDFNTSYLFNPELNLKLGNLYYSTIRGMLEGKDVSAVAAYNGGIGSVTRWKTTLNYNDVDEFVEQIPYDETKNYVKKVFRSYWNYTRIYQK